PARSGCCWLVDVYHGERLNSYTHLLGAVAAAAGLAVLVVLAAQQGDFWKLVSFSVYGATLFLLYLFSTLYHSTRGRAKPILAKLDHVAIYLLIAGSYTPFTLVTLRGAWGWTLFGLIWGLAVLGIVVDSLHNRTARRILPMVIYIVMGWLVLIAFKPLLAALPYAGLLWLVAGGLLYSLGIVFYALDKKLRHAHGIWHLFVLAGSISHYLAVLLYVA
ncbi:MAG TPA: hemolysin III family protein, partial [Acidiferrobacterales bacterium]|nr:hemolysin III family protein [Acidiferrobacterales bacterium]